MDIFDVTRNGTRCGTVEVTAAGLLTEFSFSGSAPSNGVYRLVARCETSVAMLGVAAPDSGGRLRLRKSYSKNALRELRFSLPATFELLLPEELAVSRREVHEPNVSETMRRAAELLTAAKQIEQTEASAPVPAPLTHPEPNTSNPAELALPTENEPQATSGRPETRGAEVLRRAKELSETARMSAEQSPEVSPIAAEPTLPQESPENAVTHGYTPVENATALFAEPNAYSEGPIEGAMMRVEGEVTLLAVPMRIDAPFPLLSIFCFGEPTRMGDTDYLVFRLRDGVLVAHPRG